MKILLVDDHGLFRDGLKLLLADLDQNLIFAEAATGKAALEFAQVGDITLILLDYHLPDYPGMELLAALRETAPAAVIVVLSAEVEPALIQATVQAGAAGFIPKTATHAVMTAALRLVLAGGVYLPANALVTLNRGTMPTMLPADVAATGMTPRQMEIVQKAIQGKANKVIARELDIAEATVKTHLSAAFRVLGVRNRTEAVFAAASRGLKT